MIRMQPAPGDSADVAVVGAGLGAAAFCRTLALRAPQLRIVCLERGTWIDRAALPALRPDWQQAAFGAWATYPAWRRGTGTLSADYAIDDSESDFKPLMWNGVGGSTISWAAHFPRLHPSDFATRTLDGVGCDWPFDYAALEPFYDENDGVVGVSGLDGDPAYPPKSPRHMQPLPLGRAGMAAARGFDALGWHWWPVDAAINSVPHAGRPGCNLCGPCQQGCVPGAKASSDLTHWPDALRAGVALHTGCVVRQVDIKGGRATGVRYRDASGADRRLRAQIVVVAGNGIGTPRLLLASGLRSPALGRYLMFHGAAYVRGMFDAEMDGPMGPIGCALYSHQFYETDRSRGFVRGVHLQVTRENPLLAQALRLPRPWGAEAAAQLRREFRHSVAILVLNEDLPDAENRVTLTGEMDADGLPGVRLHYRVSDHTRRALAFGLDRAEDVLRAAGAYATVRLDLAPVTGWHLLGTARMGRDPATSVTDADGCCHEVPNLIVADGSLFPTVGAVNPGSTIGALATKIAASLAGALA